MSAVLTYDEIKERYAGEWVLIVDAKRDRKTGIVHGEVVAHSKERDEVYRAIRTVEARSISIDYLGEPPSDWALARPIIFLD